jgi:hypothetical protein
MNAEVGRTTGGQVDQLQSLDGGFDFETNSTAGLPQDKKSLAVYGDISLGLYKGKGGFGLLTGYYDSREQGFSVPGRIAQSDIEAYGAEVKLPITKKFSLFAKHDYKKESNRLERTQTELNAALGIKYKFELGLKLDDKKDFSSGLFQQIDGYGQRLDGQLRFTYKPDKNTYYAYHQETLQNDDSRRKNSRTGVGVDILARKDFKVLAELSYGDGGIGAKLGSSYEYDKKFSTYQNYLIENNNASSTIDGGLHSSRKFVHGARQKFSDTKSIFYENQATDRLGASQGLSHSFGFDYTPENKWSFNFQGEFGKVESQNGASETKRKGGTIGLGYTTKATKFTQSVEYRRDENEPSGEERDTVISNTRFKHVIDEEWTLFAKADLLESKSSLGTYYDGNYKDFTLGLAFRPIDRDWWNAILKVSYFEMLPSAGKVDALDLTPEYRQRKLQVNLDNSFQLTNRFELGVKFGYAQRQLQFNRLKTGKWFDSDVLLGVVRLDVKIAKTWYAFGEYRSLMLLSSSDQNLDGMLVGVYKEILSDNRLRMGVGYNFSNFSDDLSDTKYDAKGWFFNVTAGF